MDNTQIPPVQPMTPMQGGGSMPPVGGMGMNAQSGMGPHGPMMQAGPGGPMPMGPNGMPMVQQVQMAPPPPKKDIAGLVKTIVIVILSLIAVTFIGLFIWMMTEKDAVQESHDADVRNAVAEAKDEEAMEQSQKCADEKKYPYLTFSGPADYGQLTFEYPKTWSVYVEKAANEGGDFYAYFNPVQVNEVGKDTINALRVTISTESFDKVTTDYQRWVEKKNSNLTVSSVEIGDAEKGIHQTANRYDGNIPNTDLIGSIVVFKIRDKTVILQTDSEVFMEEFNKLLSTITFNA